MPTESERQRDTWIRLTVFAWLEEQTQIHGDVLPWSFLAHGLYIDGERVPLVSQQGIWPTLTPDPDQPRERRPGRWSAGFEAA